MLNRLLAAIAALTLLAAPAVAQEISVPGGNFATPATVNLDMAGFDILKLGSLKFGSSSDAILLREAANVFAQRNGTAAQCSYIFNTYTDSSNYERGGLCWTTTSNVLSLMTSALGTGTARGIDINVGGSIWAVRTTSLTGPSGGNFLAATNAGFGWGDTFLGRSGSGATTIGTSVGGADGSLKLNGVQTGAVAVASLGTCNSGAEGTRKGVTDANATLAAGIGTTVASGGSNHVPVYCNGTNWVIGQLDLEKLTPASDARRSGALSPANDNLPAGLLLAYG